MDSSIALANWTNGFAAEYFRICILIECITGEDYEPYGNAMDFYELFIDGKPFSKEKVLRDVCEEFYHKMMVFESEYSINPSMCQYNIPNSADDCIALFFRFFDDISEGKMDHGDSLK